MTSSPMNLSTTTTCPSTFTWIDLLPSIPHLHTGRPREPGPELATVLAPTEEPPAAVDEPPRLAGDRGLAPRDEHLVCADPPLRSRLTPRAEAEQLDLAAAALRHIAVGGGHEA